MNTLTKGTPEIVVVDYGTGNIHSIIKALRLYHPHVSFTSDADRIQQAAALVLPGDGAFGTAMRNLNRPLNLTSKSYHRTLYDLIQDHVQKGLPLLGVCIGFQILFESSQECIDMNEEPINGFGFLKGSVTKFRFEDRSIRIPHMGWNRLLFKDKRQNPYMYFIHSYRVCNANPDDVAAYCDYHGSHFCALIRHENIYAAQFHPEKSDRQGLAVIKNWVEQLRT